MESPYFRWNANSFTFSPRHPVLEESLGKHQLNWTLINPLRLSLKENQKDGCLCSLTNCTRIWSICMKTTFTLPQPTYNLWQNRRSDILSLLTTQSTSAKILLEWNIYCTTCNVYDNKTISSYLPKFALFSLCLTKCLHLNTPFWSYSSFPSPTLASRLVTMGLSGNDGIVRLPWDCQVTMELSGVDGIVRWRWDCQVTRPRKRQEYFLALIFFIFSN